MNIKFLALACLFVTFQKIQSMHSLFNRIPDRYWSDYKLEEYKRENILALLNSSVKSELEATMPDDNTPRIVIFDASLGYAVRSKGFESKCSVGGGCCGASSGLSYKRQNFRSAFSMGTCSPVLEKLEEDFSAMEYLLGTPFILGICPHLRNLKK